MRYWVRCGSTFVCCGTEIVQGGPKKDGVTPADAGSSAQVRGVLYLQRSLDLSSSVSETVYFLTFARSDNTDGGD